MMTAEELTKVYAEAWEKLDVSVIAPYLADDFTYGSMWVFQSLDRDGYLDYLKGKFEAIESSDTKPEVKTGYSENGDPCVWLNQNGNIAFIHVKAKDGKIAEVYMMAF